MIHYVPRRAIAKNLSDTLNQKLSKAREVNNRVRYLCYQRDNIQPK